MKSGFGPVKSKNFANAMSTELLRDLPPLKSIRRRPPAPSAIATGASSRCAEQYTPHSVLCVAQIHPKKRCCSIGANQLFVAANRPRIA